MNNERIIDNIGIYKKYNLLSEFVILLFHFENFV